MKEDWSELEKYRVSPKGYESKAGDRFGWFLWLRGKTQIRAMVTDGDEEHPWEHVSITVAYQNGKKWVERDPRWEEMCWIKSLFWGPEECVVQFHPPESNYVNNHPHCLHLWKSKSGAFPMPPTICV
jgi:hypothetical protein